MDVNEFKKMHEAARTYKAYQKLISARYCNDPTDADKYISALVYNNDSIDLVFSNEDIITINPNEMNIFYIVYCNSAWCLSYGINSKKNKNDNLKSNLSLASGNLMQSALFFDLEDAKLFQELANARVKDNKNKAVIYKVRIKDEVLSEFELAYTSISGKTAIPFYMHSKSYEEVKNKGNIPSTGPQTPITKLKKYFEKIETIK